ncbi:MAG: glutamine-hydrolyzing carbamoyl-phosphate synthase small subunit [Candidatus Palauibacterales bacterium]|nr:glutamine-hydrolyzing carbamoyl-phosphate synthase small subunit [Candidatus Palauibacterales bacterium]
MLPSQEPAGYLLLEDGTRYDGWLAGRTEGGTGEVVFTTNMTGYQEVLTDPSYAGQVVVMTAPMMGVYGVREGEDQSRKPWVSGFVVRELTDPGDNPRADAGTLRDYLEGREIPALVGVDTRALTRRIREEGAMRGTIVPADVDPDEARERLEGEPSMNGRDLANSVTVESPYEVEPDGPERGEVICLDYGVKYRSLELIAGAGYRVRVVPSDTPAGEIVERSPSGVFVSNGPGDPDAVEGAVERVRSVSDAGLPVFGICLGQQLVARAFGGSNFKLLYGHRGGNHPVKNLDTGDVEITSQNHGFAVEEEDDGGVAGAPDLRITHRNLNDGTIEGLAHRERPVFAVQYHPESAPGPHDSRYLFDRFVAAMQAG